MDFKPTSDLWEYLAGQKKSIVLYGMGNGADKILRVCDAYGIVVSDFFASDGFVRGHQFHGKTVLSYTDIRQKYGDGNFIILVSFATSLPDVMTFIRNISTQNELYVPDVPVFGEELFNKAFCTTHADDLEAARNLLADKRSREVFDAVIRYRLGGRIEDLEASVCDPHEVMQNLLHPERYRITADLGAYNGDTVQELLSFAPNVEQVYALEPDTRTFRKLSDYAVKEARCQVKPVNACAWNQQTILSFDASGNRNANVNTGAKKVRQVQALTLDEVVGDTQVDYIKYDVEGSEFEALEGSLSTIQRCRPELLISLYHRSADLFFLPLYLHKIIPESRFFLRRFPYYPAWDLNLYVTG